MRFKIFILASYVFVLPLVLTLAILISLYFFHQHQTSLKKSWGIAKASPHYESLPAPRASVDQEIEAEDARVAVLDEFFVDHDSPLSEHGAAFVETADKYGLDYRLLPAIAMQESNLCKKTPKDSNNCWGFGIYGGRVMRFSNYEEGIETVARGLSKNYVAHGLVEPEEIMKKYTPGSNGSWANGVNYFMDDIGASL